MILLRRLLAALLIVFTLPAMAGEPPAEPAPVEKAANDQSSASGVEEPAKPALWKIADEDTTIWLFGTVHLLPPGINWYRGPVSTALESSGEMVTEIIEPEPEAAKAILGKYVIRNDGKLLRGTLTDDERARYEAALATLGLPESAFDRVDTWYAAVLMSSLPLLQQGYSQANGVEAFLVKQAARDGARRIGLETMDYQLGIFDGLSDQVQRDYLDEIVEQMPTITDELTNMVTAWKAGDADELARIINEDESNPMLMKVLITDRNRNWSEWIRHRLESPGTVFMAVGAGHLAGEGSVQEQLSGMGILSTRVQ